MSNGTITGPIVGSDQGPQPVSQAVSVRASAELESSWSAQFSTDRLTALASASDAERQAWREESSRLLAATSAVESALANSKTVAQAYMVRLEDTLAASGSDPKVTQAKAEDIAAIYGKQADGTTDVLSKSRVSQLRNVARVVIDCGFPLTEPDAGWFVSKGIMSMSKPIAQAVELAKGTGGHPAAIAYLRAERAKKEASELEAQKKARQDAADLEEARKRRESAESANGQDTTSNGAEAAAEGSDAAKRASQPPAPAATLSAEDAYHRAIDALAAMPERTAEDVHWLMLLSYALTDRLESLPADVKASALTIATEARKVTDAETAKLTAKPRPRSGQTRKS